mgnify:CR=1 FL=1
MVLIFDDNSEIGAHVLGIGDLICVPCSLYTRTYLAFVSVVVHVESFASKENKNHIINYTISSILI